MSERIHDSFDLAQPEASLHAFHDADLAHACAPVALIRRSMLGDDAGPPRWSPLDAIDPPADPRRISHTQRTRIAPHHHMPEKATLKRARAHLRKGDAPSTAAGEFIREEIEHIRHGKHGARSTKQAIAIGLSKARRAGVPLEDPRAGNPQTKKQARRERAASKRPHKPDARRSRAIKKALSREPHRTASKKALSRHAKRTAKQAQATRRRHERTGAVRSRRSAAKKAAQTRKRTATRSTRAHARKRTATRSTRAHARKRTATRSTRAHAGKRTATRSTRAHAGKRTATRSTRAHARKRTTKRTRRSSARKRSSSR